MAVTKSPGRVRVQLKRLFDVISNDGLKISILQAIPFWIASLLTGLLAVGYTRLFNFSEWLLHGLLSWHGWLIFFLAPFGLLAGWLIVKIFAPNARGSGIPQVMAAIELSSPKFARRLSRLLSLRIIIVKVVSSMFMVLGGAAIGREGPTIQIAGSVFRMVSKWIPPSWPRISQKSFIITGAAAGLAAAFNTPLGGIVFAMEELARIHISFFRSALFTAVIIAGLTAQLLLGPYLYLGYPDVSNVDHVVIFSGVIAAAAVAGLLGSAMCKLILRLMRWRRGLGTLSSVLFVLGSGLVIASIAFFFSSEVLGSGKDIMLNTLFSSHKQVSWQTVCARMAGPILSFNVGGAGGVFAPALGAGAAIGAFLSGLFGFVGANANIIILSGMVGFLTGVTRTPFTSAILVLEMTDRHSVIFHLMLAALVANIVALIMDKHSFYEQLKKSYLNEEPKVPMRRPPVSPDD